MNIIKSLLRSGEKVIIIILAILMALVLFISTFELGVIIFKEVIETPAEKGMVLDISELSRIFSFFLYILIGLELFVTVVMFLKENVIHGEVILLVGITAVSRKIIIQDYEAMEPITIIGLALLIGTMSLGYFLIKRSHRDSENTSQTGNQKKVY